MPNYRFACPDCGHEFDKNVNFRVRHEVWCPLCAQSDLISICECLPSAPSFTVTGFNAKNGYSK